MQAMSFLKVGILLQSWATTSAPTEASGILQENKVKTHVSPLFPRTILLCNIHRVQEVRKSPYLITSVLYLLSSKEQIGASEKCNCSRATARVRSTWVLSLMAAAVAAQWLEKAWGKGEYLRLSP